jgi:cellulose synthase/poly-beta-1,6-N-acetylglucosamine synthase-like glycosyltransferase
MNHVTKDMPIPSPPNPEICSYTGLVMKCSIVIWAYNESKHLGRLLEGLARQTCRDVEIILVDSGSTDSTVQIADSFGANIVHIRPQESMFERR